jgi:hypothetical protein
MQTGSENSPQSSKSSANLRLEFFESGDGETILIRFPDGDFGLIDAHPSWENSRPGILELIDGKRLHFVCLTHPHADHGVDLIPVLQRQKDIGEFWHTNPDTSSFIYFCATQRWNYPSPVRDLVNRLADGWADFLLDLYSSVGAIPERRFHSRVQPTEIAGVEIWCLGPDEQIANNFVKTYKDRARGHAKWLPNPNLLSAIFALRYGDTVAILGADALKQNWKDAITIHRKHGLPRAVLLKVPHHGASNALELARKRDNYLDLCGKDGTALSVLFAGDADHPDEAVFRELRARTRLICLSNGLKGAVGPANPLRLRMPGARLARPSYICNPQIIVELNAAGVVSVIRGSSCEVCK